MTLSARTRPAPLMVLDARTARDLMTANPVSIHQAATVGEAAAFLSGRGISAAPVIDEAGRPVGVVSGTDLLTGSTQTPLEAEHGLHPTPRDGGPPAARRLRVHPVG